MPVEPAPPRAPAPAARRARHGRRALPTEETTTPAATTGGIR
ncbi:hypothetical protein ACTPOK_27650 [Streptomyces inhibens]